MELKLTNNAGWKIYMKEERKEWEKVKHLKYFRLRVASKTSQLRKYYRLLFDIVLFFFWFFEFFPFQQFYMWIHEQWSISNKQLTHISHRNYVPISRPTDRPVMLSNNNLQVIYPLLIVLSHLIRIQNHNYMYFSLLFLLVREECTSRTVLF